MPKRLIQFIFILTFCLLPKIASAGIIIRPVINTGLVGYWSFNEGTGTKVGDMSGNGNNCTWSGSGSHWTDGKFGKGGNIIETDDRTNCGTNDIYDFTGNFTVSAWFKLSSMPSGSYMYIVGRANASYYLDGGEEKGYYLVVEGNSGSVLRFIFNVGGANGNSNVDWQPSGGFSPDVWHHVVGVRDGEYLRLYFDGISVNWNWATFGSASAPGQTLYAGYHYLGSSMDTQIDEVRIYNRDLDASEVTKLYESGLSRIGVNRLGLVPDDLPANATVSYVRENCTGYSPCYTSLWAWENAWGGIDFSGCDAGDLTCVNKVAVAKIDGPWSDADTTAFIIDDWVTDATRYIKIYTTASARHSGKWDNTKYRMEVGDDNGNAIDIWEDYVRIDGLQIKKSYTLSGTSRPILSRYSADTSAEVYISNNILVGNFSAGSTCAGISSEKSGITRIWNNIIYNFVNGTNSCWGIIVDGGTQYVYNNTIQNSYTGIWRWSGTPIVKNNLISSCTTATQSLTGSANVDYNATDLSSLGYTAQAHDRTSQTFKFADEANDDFHLGASDPGARNYGTDLSADAVIPFSTDIDRQDRKGTWDIGADEAKGTVIGASQANQITNGLVGYWSFNGPDIDGNTAIDRSTGGNNGTITGAIPDGGKVGQALSFDAVDDIVDNGANLAFGTNTPWTFSAWLYWLGSSAVHVSFTGPRGTNGANLWLRLDFDNHFVYREGGGAYDMKDFANGSSSSLINKWTHVAFMADGNGNLTLYKDGAFSETLTGLTRTDVDFRYLGEGYYDAFTSYGGKIDEVRIYNRVLTAQEIQRLYNLGR